MWMDEVCSTQYRLPLLAVRDKVELTTSLQDNKMNQVQHTTAVVDQFAEGERSANFFDLLRMGFTPIRHANQKMDGVTKTYNLLDLPLTSKRLMAKKVLPSDLRIAIDVHCDLRIQIRSASGNFKEGPFASSANEARLLLTEISEIQRLKDREQRHIPPEFLERESHARSVQRIVSTTNTLSPNVAGLTGLHSFQ